MTFSSSAQSTMRRHTLQAVVPKGLIWYCPLTPWNYNSAGRYYYDLSGNGNNATNYSQTPVAYTNGRANAVSGNFLTANTNCLRCGTASTFTLTNMSIACWTYRNGTTTADGTIIGKGYAASTPYDSYCLNANRGGGGKVSWEIGITVCDATITDPANTWTHYVGTYDGSKMILYVNGVSNNAVARSGALSFSSWNFVVSGVPERASYYYNGRVDEGRLYDHALTPTDVTNLFKTGY